LTADGRHGPAEHAAVIATFAWLLPMTAVCASTLAVAVASRSASAGAVVGVTAWSATVLALRTASGDLTAAVTNSLTYLPYLAVAACAVAVIRYSTRTQRGAL
jgi:hypothetical protein